MSRVRTWLGFLPVGVAAIAMAPHAIAAVLILEGAPSPTGAPAQATAPAGLPPRDELPALLPAPPASSARPAPSGPGESGIPSAEPAPTIATPAPAAAPLAMPSPPAPPSPAAVAAPALASAPTDLGTGKVANPAEVSLEIMPGQTVTVGSRVSFRVTSRKGGYLVLVDVDPTGHLAQIYPNTASLVRTSRVNGNYIKPGGTMTIPLVTDPYAGIQYVVSPPNGQAMIVAVLSAQPVQILDLPDVPPDVKDRSEILPYLSKWMNELRIPDSDSQMREAKWSLNAKPYVIQ